MNNSPVERRSLSGLFPGEPTPRLYDCVVEFLHTRRYIRRTEQAYMHWRSIAMATGKRFMQVSLNKSWVSLETR